MKEHLGIASLPYFIGDKEPGIHRIPGAEALPGEWIWVLAHKDMMTNAKVRTLTDFLFNAFQKHTRTIEGH